MLAHLTMVVSVSLSSVSTSIFVMAILPVFTNRAKTALLEMDSGEDRVETILFLLQTSVAAAEGGGPIYVSAADVRAAQLMVEMQMHLLGEIGFDGTY